MTVRKPFHRGSPPPLGNSSAKKTHFFYRKQKKRKHWNSKHSPRHKLPSIPSSLHGHSKPPTPTSSQDLVLPVCAYRKKIVEAVQSHACVVLSGETGSGKTTQVPQFLLDDAGYLSIAVTQPRRISAVTLAHRVSQERNCPVGTQVGYSVRFEEVTSKQTRIKYLTDGMLLRETMVDPLLSHYQVIVLDEAHERSVRTDVLLGFMKSLLLKRTDLKVIIMSATMEASLFSDFFKGAHVFSIPGRLHEIRVFHTQSPVTDYLDASLRTLYDIYHHRPEGDVLAFFNGQEDIEAAVTLLKENHRFMPNLLVTPFFAHLPLPLQRKVFAKTPVGHRKVVLATNLAESSITLPGVRYVIDHGLAKIKYFHPKIGIESLFVMPISKANALQRTGRAGREAPGCVFRLYTEQLFHTLEEFPVPELLRADLSQVCLQLALWSSPIEFLQPPNQTQWVAAHQQLTRLGALDAHGITPLGRAMLRYPVAPHIARILVKSPQVTLDLLSLVALVSQDTVFYTPMGITGSGASNEEDTERMLERRRVFTSPEGDLITWLNALKAYERMCSTISENEKGTCHKDKETWCTLHGLDIRALQFVLRVRTQLAQLYAQPLHQHPPVTTASLLQHFLQGYFNRLAFLHPTQRYYVTISNRKASLHPSSVLAHTAHPPPPVIGFLEIVGNETGKWYLRGITKVDPAWVQPLLKHLDTSSARVAP